MIGGARGFTLIELIAVIVILSILSVVSASRFSEGSAGVQASRDDVIAALFYAQQIAMARDSATNPIRLVTTTTSVNVTENGTPLLHAGVQYPLVLGSGVTLLATVNPLNFDKLGRTTASTFTLSRSGVSATITVSDSGYAN